MQDLGACYYSFLYFCSRFKKFTYMKTSESLLSIGKFIAEYSAHLMGAGVHTSRVVRNSKRLGEAFGLDVKLGVFHKNIILTIIDKETNEACNEVIDIPAHPISFEHNSELSALSWEAVDHHLSLEELKEKYKKIISAPMMHPLFVLILVGFANASFCKLFGGDLISMGIVFSATLTGLYLKQQMQKKKMNHYIIFIVSAFVASLCASTALIFDTTSEIALATSVLYLVPGVPLINGVIDVVEGYVLTGFARLTEASLLIVSIAIGLSFTLLMVKNSLI
jgi:membrane protein